MYLSKASKCTPYAWWEQAEIGSCGFPRSVFCDEANKSDILKTAQGISLRKYCVIHMIEKHERRCLCQKALVMIPRHGNYQELPVTSKKMFDYYYFFIFYFFLDFFEPFFKKFTFSKPSEFMSCGWIFLFLHQSLTLCSNSFSICTHNTQRSVNMIPFLNPVSFFVIHGRVLNMCVRGNAKSNKQETNISRFVWSCSLHRTQTKNHTGGKRRKGKQV